MSRPSGPLCPPPRPDGPEPADLVRRVEAALRSHAHVDHCRIRVLLADGVVTLQGTVASIDQREAAGAATRRTPGVAAVRNELVVDGVIRAAF